MVSRVTTLLVVLFALTQGTIHAAPRTDWEQFRKAHPLHIQAFALSKSPDQSGFRTLIITEPPPHITVEGILSVSPTNLSDPEVFKHKIGYDGWVKDIVLRARGSSEQLDGILAQLSRLTFFTSQKTYVLPLPDVSVSPIRREKLDLRVTATDLHRWFNDEKTKLVSLQSSRSYLLKDLDRVDSSEILITDPKGLLVWWLPTTLTLKECRAQARIFALESDLIIGIGTLKQGTAIVARKRQISVAILPPLRTETIELLSEADTDELGQSFERLRGFAGLLDRKRDWGPIYLSPELVDTEFGSLLNITDQILKSWSELGDCKYDSFEYPKPTNWPFDKPLRDLIEARPVVYNWHSMGVGYRVLIDGIDWYCLNRTGSLPVNFSPQLSGKEAEAAHQLETKAYDYFAELGDVHLARVVQYLAIYQGLHSLQKQAAPRNAASRVDKQHQAYIDTVLSVLKDAKKPDSQDKFEKDFSAEASARGAQMKGDAGLVNLRGFQKAIIGLNDEELLDYAIKLSEDIPPRMTAANAYIFNPVAGALGLIDRYSKRLEIQAKGWVHTPSIVVSTSGDLTPDGQTVKTLGGHNLGGLPTLIAGNNEVPEGHVQVSNKGEILLNYADLRHLQRMSAAATRIRGPDPTDMAKALEKRDTNLKSLQNELEKARKAPEAKLPSIAEAVGTSEVVAGSRNAVRFIGVSEWVALDLTQEKEDRLVKQIQSSGPRDLLVLPSARLSDQNVQNALATSASHLIIRSDVPDGTDARQSVRLLTTKVRSVKIVAVLPTTEEAVRNVFPEKSGAEAKKVAAYMDGVRKTLVGLPNVVIIDRPNGNESMATSLERAISNGGENEAIFLLAHNSGEEIPLPDGKPITLGKAQRLVSGRVGAILTCESIQAGTEEGKILTTRILEFDSVARALRDVVNAWRKNGAGDEVTNSGNSGEREFGELLSHINLHLNSDRGPADRLVKLIVSVVSAGMLKVALFGLKDEPCGCGEGCECCKLNADGALPARCNRPGCRKMSHRNVPRE